MPSVASLALLFVAAGLLVLAAVGFARGRGTAVSPTLGAALAGLTGVALGFLSYVMPVMPLLLFPIVLGVALTVEWVRRGAWPSFGAFLMGAGGLWAAGQFISRMNDLADQAVSIPDWSPVPLGLGVAAMILGGALLLVGDDDAPA